MVRIRTLCTAAIKISRPALVLTLFVALMGLSGCAGKTGTGDADGFALTVLHTNDSHSTYGGYTEKGLMCYAAICEDGSGGSVRLQQAVRAVRRDIPDALFLDAGDVFQGSLFWALHKEKMPAQIMDRLGYEAVIPGNHEFDDGCPPFLRHVDALQTPMLAANLSFSGTFADSAAKIRPYIIVERNGRSIGIVGLVTSEVPTLAAPCTEAVFADEHESLQAAVRELSAKGVNIIIALTHIGLENDRRLAQTVDGVDIFVGGHSHSLLANTQPKAEAVYPIVEKTPSGDPVLVVSAGSTTSYLGKLDARFDDDGILVAWQGDAIPMNDATLAAMNAPARDEEMLTILEEFVVPVRAMMESGIGSILVAGKDGIPLEDPNVRECRKDECLTGNVVTDALRAQVFKDTPHIVLMNGGGLRASLPGGSVTPADILDTLPYRNTPYAAQLDGATIRAALEHGVSTYGEGEGRFLQVAGLRYAFDPALPPGQRVTSVDVQNTAGRWQPLDPAAKYPVITVDFIAKGGDGFSMLTNADWRESDILIDDAVRIHLEKNSPLRPTLEGRIRIGR